MGWTSYYATHFKNGKIDREAECLENLRSDKFDVLKSAMVGSTFYAAIKNKQSGDVFGAVILTKTERGQEFYYKPLDEDSGPCETKCPKSILKLLTPTTNKYALEWRKQCEEYHKSKSNAAKMPSLNKLPLGTKIKVVLDTNMTWGSGATISKGTELILYNINLWDKTYWLIENTRMRLSTTVIRRCGFEICE